MSKPATADGPLADYGVSGRACLLTLATPARARTTGRKQREQHA